MARTRLLHPKFFSNEQLGDLPFEARLCYAGLWCLADRAGRLEDRPKRIRVELFPYDSIDVDQVLQRLHDGGFILRYTVDAARFIEIPKFLEYQTPHIREAKSVIPAPAESIDPARDQAGTSTDLLQGKASEGSPVRVPVSVSVPVPVSVSERDTPTSAENADAAPQPTLPITPAPTSQQQAGRRGNRRTPKHLLTMPEEMAPVWALYPNKDGRQEAIQAWQQVRPAEDDRQRMLAHVDLKRKTVEWTKDEGRFCPRLSSYLRGRRWLDEGFQMPDGAAVEPVKFGPPASRAEIEQIATMKRAMLGRLPCTHEPACATDGDHDRALINGWRAPLGIGPLPFVVAPRRRGDA
jgi:hypothetical protein